MRQYRNLWSPYRKYHRKEPQFPAPCHVSPVGPPTPRRGPCGTGYTKSMLKKKLNPRGPKKRKLVRSLQT